MMVNILHAPSKHFFEIVNNTHERKMLHFHQWRNEEQSVHKTCAYEKRNGCQKYQT